MHTLLLVSLSLIIIPTVHASERAIELQQPPTQSTLPEHKAPAPIPTHPHALYEPNPSPGAIVYSIVCCAGFIALGGYFAYDSFIAPQSTPCTKYIYINNHNTTHCTHLETPALCFPSPSEYASLNKTLQTVCPNNLTLTVKENCGYLPCTPFNEGIATFNKTCNAVCNHSSSGTIAQQYKKLTTMRNKQKRK